MVKPLKKNAKNSIAQKLRDLAARHGSNPRAADSWGIPLRTLASYLAGESSPKLSTLEAIADYEGIEIVQFFSDNAKNSIAQGFSVPVRDICASAGAGADNEDEPIIGYMTFPSVVFCSWGRSPENVEAVQVRGDSMWPTISDGQWVLLDRADKRLVDGKVFAFRTAEGLRLKRYQTGINGVPMLVSDNRELYAPELLQPSDLEQLRVAGRVFLPLKPI
jgi:phage repressor protein C with HTH and peptisase S24 domain